jgi:hypothetical protein
VFPASDSNPQIRDVFLSHTSSDKLYVRSSADALRHKNLSLWFDEEQVEPGASFVPQIGEGLRARSAVAVISRTYLERPWPRKELSVLIARHVHDGMPLTIIAHGVENATIDSEVPLLLDHPAIPSSKSPGEIAANISAALHGARRRAVEIKSPQVPNQRISLGHLPTTSGELLGRDNELDTIDRL